MATGKSTTAQIDELIPLIYEQARLTQMEEPVMRQLVERYDIKSKPGNEVLIPRYGTVKAKRLTEGIDLTDPEQIATTGTTLYVFEAGAQTVLTDDSIEDANDDVMRKHGTILGQAMAEQDDLDGLEMFHLLTKGLGGDGKRMGVGHFTAAMSILRNAKAKGDFYCVLHPFVYHDLATAVVLNSAYGTLRPAGDEMGKKFRVNEFLGVRIFEDANIVVGDGVEDPDHVPVGTSVGGFFTKGCIGRVEKRALRIEKERDASARHWELNATTRYGYGLVEPTWGVKLTFETVEPTGEAA